MRRISRDGLLALLNTGAVTVGEALPAAYCEAERLPGAVNRPGERTAGLAPRLVPDRDRIVVTHCSGPSCSRSETAAVALERLGRTDVRVYDGGKADWAQAGLSFDGTRTAARAS